MNPRFLLASLTLFLTAAPAAAAAPLLLPKPVSLVEGQGRFTVTDRTPLVGDGAASAAFADLMRRSLWSRPPGPVTAGRLEPWNVQGCTRPDGQACGTIAFRRVAGLAAEAYRIAADGTGVAVSASDAAGLYYGAVTLWQLATQPGREGTVPAVAVEDRPRYPWRGLMLDSARHFQSPAFIKRFIEWMALNKLNRFHWHLVDDQGWRLEIRKYPRLTGVSAWRRPATAAGAPPLPQVGGFYTQAEVREIVAFAAARGVTIVPEIEMPGHALSAIRAYPRLGTGAAVPVGVESDWGVFPWLYRTDGATFRFLEDVLDEVMALFPSRDIHVGGDEAVKDQWRASPAVQARIKALGLKDEEALQGWFTAHIGAYLARHGRRMVGWDEILDGGVPADAVIMSWRGVEGAAKAAMAGHDAIVAAAPTLYFDHRQGSGPDEPPGRGEPVTLARVQAFDPTPPGLPAGAGRHIIGLQGQVWTEHVRTEDRVAWMGFPRAMAVAETGWSGAGGDYADFLTRLQFQLARMAPLGLKAATTAFALPSPVASDMRASSELVTCSAKVDLYLEDDAPADGQRVRFLIDILDPCWRWNGAAMDGVAGLELAVGQLPFNFQVGKDKDAIRFRPPATPSGEMEVRDGCGGALVATLPLAPAAASPAVTVLRAPIEPLSGAHDLCFTYTARGPDPLWAIGQVRLVR